MPRLSARALVIYAGLLLTTGAFSVDITLPFFRPMREGLAASQTSIQATVTLYIASLGLGQLLFGPLSDRFGRRPAIGLGLALYSLGALLALSAQDIIPMLIGRAIQGLGAAAGPVVSRAMLRDLFKGRELAQAMALATGIFALGPILAPLLGVLILQAGGGWRVVFMGMLGLALLLFAGLACAPETLAQRTPRAMHPETLLRNALTLLSHPQSRHFLIAGPLAQSTMLCIVAGMPRVFEQTFGVTGTLFALLFALHGPGIVIGQIANHRLIARLGAARTALAASLLTLAASGLIALCAALGWLGPFLFSFFVFLFAIGFLIVMANAASLALDPHPGIAGFTSSFLGFSTMVPGAMIAMLAVTVSGGDALALGVSLCVLCAFSSAWLARWVLRRGTTIDA